MYKIYTNTFLKQKKKVFTDLAQIFKTILQTSKINFTLHGTARYVKTVIVLAVCI